MKPKITNTTAEVAEKPMVGLMTSLPGGVEASEARGQRELVSQEGESVSLPVDGSTDPEVVALGIEWGDPVDDDPIFRAAKLPQGWRLKPTDHAMWSNLEDAEGKVRAKIFYKAAFYDRSAFIHAA